MMKSFVSDPLRIAGYFGKATAALLLVFNAPAWVLAVILVGGPTLFLRLSDRARRQAEERHREEMEAAGIEPASVAVARRSLQV
jgi:hypothetical protein